MGIDGSGKVNKKKPVTKSSNHVLCTDVQKCYHRKKFYLKFKIVFKFLDIDSEQKILFLQCMNESALPPLAHP